MEPADTEEAPETLTLRLAGFDSHGTTRARIERRWIEVEHGIPAEVVKARVTGGKRRPIGKIVEVLEPSPSRVEPPCRYFREWDCGGCQWQQIVYPSQLDFKRAETNGIMRAAGLTLEVDRVHALDDPWRYRFTAGISLGRHAGFRRHASQAIVPIHDCPISHPLIGALMAALNEAIDHDLLPDFHGRVRLEVRVAGTVDGRFLQILVRPSGPDDVLGEEAGTLVRLLQKMESVGGISVVRAGRRVETVKGDLLAPTTVAGRPVWLAAASFFQTNLLLLPDLIGRLAEEVGTAEQIADVYGGVGILGLFLAEKAGEVVVIESDALAVEAGERTAREWGVTNVRFMEAPAEEALGGGYDVVILDPPRSGLTDGVMTALLAGRPRLILYVSCLAESLARDLGPLLEAGYRTESLELFDFYPQTYHVELLAVLRRPSEVS